MKRILARSWKLVKRILLVVVVFQFAYLLLIRWVNPPITITQLCSLIAGDGLKRDYVSFDQINSSAKLAVIASEDQLFPDHHGFDYNSIEKAIKHNEKHPNRVHGASTISQQVAKNVFLWQGRSWFRKGLEVYFTFMIECIYSKQRILDLYLNVVEMGEGIYGIESAARNYFGKPASKLSRKESAMIAACLPNPKVYKVKPMGKWVAKRYPWILSQMDHLYSDPEIDAIVK